VRLNNLTDDDVVISLLDNCGHPTFDRARSIDENWSAGFALAEWLTAELAVGQIRW